MARAVTSTARSLRLESRPAILMVEGRHRHREGKKEEGLRNGGRLSQRHPSEPYDESRRAVAERALITFEKVVLG
jgi:hypothetical protein